MKTLQQYLTEEKHITHINFSKLTNEGKLNTNQVHRMISSWVTDCMEGNDNDSLSNAGELIDAMIGGLEEGIRDYGKKQPGDKETLKFLKFAVSNLGNVYNY